MRYETVWYVMDMSGGQMSAGGAHGGSVPMRAGASSWRVVLTKRSPHMPDARFCMSSRKKSVYAATKSGVILKPTSKELTQSTRYDFHTSWCMVPVTAPSSSRRLMGGGVANVLCVRSTSHRSPFAPLRHAYSTSVVPTSV